MMVKKILAHEECIKHHKFAYKEEAIFSKKYANHLFRIKTKSIYIKMLNNILEIPQNYVQQVYAFNQIYLY